MAPEVSEVPEGPRRGGLDGNGTAARPPPRRGAMTSDLHTGPRAHDAVSALAAGALVGSRSPKAEPKAPRRRALVVEDDPTAQRVLLEVLRSLGVDARAAASLAAMD